MGKSKHTAPGKDVSLKIHLSGKFTQMADPLGGLSGAERQQALEAVAAKARTDFDASVAQLKTAVRRFSPMQLLAHFAYYDQIHLYYSEASTVTIPRGKA